MAASLVVAGDAYLDALKAEAATITPEGEVAPAGEAPPQSGNSLLAKPQKVKSDLTPGLDKVGFEKDLKENFHGSFLFYEKLTDTEKERVFTFYKDVPEITRIRRQILRIMTR